MFTPVFWRRIAETFGVSFISLFGAQLVDLQNAIISENWSTVHALGIAALFAAATSLGKAVWLVAFAKGTDNKSLMK